MVDYAKVCDFDAFYSDVHCFLIITLSTDISVNDADKNRKPLIKIRKWSHEKFDEFVNNINKNSLQNITIILENLSVDKQTKVNNAVSEMNKLFLDAEEATCGLVLTRTSHSVKQQTKNKQTKNNNN